MTTSAPTPITSQAPDQQKAASAFAQLEPEINAVPESALIRINVDISRTVSLVLGAAPGIRSLRSRIVAECAGFPIEQLDKLENYAFAAWYTHLLAMPASSAMSPVQPLLEEAAPLREDMLVGAESLVHFGFFDAARVAEIRKGSGHVDIASDLVALAAMYDEKWGEVGSKTAVTREVVDRAAAVGAELIVALGARLQPNGEPLLAGAAATRRARAFTLFMNAYNECRRVVSFLRWNEGDAEQIAPSPYMKTRRREALAAVEAGATIAAPVSAAPETPAVPFSAPVVD